MASKVAGVGLSTVNEVTQEYYDSSDADTFYRLLWGGEDIHIGLYDTPDEDVFTASRRTVEHMCNHLDGVLTAASCILDMGSGYGGGARSLTQRFNCKVTALNISEIQNAYARELTERAGLADQVEVVWGNFENMPFEDETFDLVWSMDAMLHSGNRAKVVAEVARVLRPGGRFLFTDILQAEDATREELTPVLKRIHLDTMGSWSFYKETTERVGFSPWVREDHSLQLPTHYGRVLEELEKRWNSLLGPVSETYMENACKGLKHWIEAGQNGQLAWGIQGYAKNSM